MTTQPTKGTSEQVNESPPPQLVNKFHTRSDLDSKTWAQHHTLGIKANQASPGDHNHDGTTSRQITAEANPSIFSWGAWTAIPTYSPGVSNYGSGFAPGQYRISTMGDVEVRGLLSASSAVGECCRLSAGTAPTAGGLIDKVKTQTGTSRIDIGDAGGGIAILGIGEPTIAGWFSLSGVQWSTR